MQPAGPAKVKAPLAFAVAFDVRLFAVEACGQRASAWCKVAVEGTSGAGQFFPGFGTVDCGGAAKADAATIGSMGVSQLAISELA